jgi:hypothetical protein
MKNAEISVKTTGVEHFFRHIRVFARKLVMNQILTGISFMSAFMRFVKISRNIFHIKSFDTIELKLMMSAVFWR